MNSHRSLLKIKKMFLNREHPVWVLINQFSSRILVAIKFLAVATFLGPSAIGLAGIGLVALAVLESLTETGLHQAYTQTKIVITREMSSAIWLVQFFRGCIVAIFLFLIAYPLQNFLNQDGVANVLMLISIAPILRNSKSLGQTKAYRNSDFRGLAFNEVFSNLIDLIFALLAYKQNYGAYSILIGNIAGEIVRFIFSWYFFSENIFFKPAFNKIKELNLYGKWIWYSSIISLISSQYDKIVIAKFLGTSSLGGMQMASKASQLMYVDLANAAATYLFPKLSEKNRISSNLVDVFFRDVVIKILYVFFVVTVFVLLSLWIFKDNIPENWKEASFLIVFLIPYQFISAIYAVFSAHLRAIGKPDVVTKTTIIQAAGTIIISTPLCYFYKIEGVIIGNTISVSLAFTMMYLGYLKIIRGRL